MTGSRYVYAYGSALATLAYGAGPTTGYYATDAFYVLATYAPLVVLILGRDKSNPKSTTLVHERSGSQFLYVWYGH